jgi:hypothetical protein
VQLSISEAKVEHLRALLLDGTVSPKEYSAAIGCSIRSVYYLIRAGKLQTRRVPGLREIRIEVPHS